MISRFEWLIAMRYLKSTKKAGFISFFAVFSFLGIALGVTTLIVVTSVMNGFRENLLNAIVGMRPHIIISGSVTSDEPDIQKAFEPHENLLLQKIPFVEQQGILSHLGQARGVIVQGTTPEDFNKRPRLMEALQEGCLDDFEGNAIIIGHTLAEELGIHLDDSVALLSPKGNATAFGTLPKQRAFKVVGIFNYGMRDYDKSFVFMPLTTAQDFYNKKNTIDFWGIFLKDLSRACELINGLSLPDRMVITDWKHQDQQIFHAVEVEKNVMFLILSLLVIIAGFNITSSLVMLVQDKRRAIGILKTLGATSHSIMRIFTLIGLSIGVVGTILGVTLGVLIVVNIHTIQLILEAILNTKVFSPEIYYLSRLPAVLVVKDVLLITFFSLLLSLLSSIFPARTAARLNPISVL